MGNNNLTQMKLITDLLEKEQEFVDHLQEFKQTLSKLENLDQFPYAHRLQTAIDNYINSSNSYININGEDLNTKALINQLNNSINSNFKQSATTLSIMIMRFEKGYRKELDAAKKLQQENDLKEQKKKSSFYKRSADNLIQLLGLDDKPIASKNLINLNDANVKPIIDSISKSLPIIIQANTEARISFINQVQGDTNIDNIKKIGSDLSQDINDRIAINKLFKDSKE